MIVLWGLYILPAVFIYKLIKRYSVNQWIHRSILAILILVPTYDIILTNILGGYYCLITPSTYINKKVEYPLSIYWEDDVYPGFSAEDRKLMIINYLDGKHLKKMALNGDDGKIYVFEAKEGDFKSFKYDEKFENRYAQYASIIMNNEKVYTKETMPQMNYTVQFDEIKLNPLSQKFIYADETRVIDNNTSETIAYNRRYMPFWYNVAPDFALGNRYYSSWAWEICQQENHERNEEKVFSSLNYHYYEADAPTLNEKLYNKYIKGEK